MLLAAQIAGMLGWRGAVGIVVGGTLLAIPAYQAGKWTEGAASEERIKRVVAERDVSRREEEDGRIKRALAARRDADGVGGDRIGDGGLPDDGYRRD